MSLTRNKVVTARMKRRQRNYSEKPFSQNYISRYVGDLIPDAYQCTLRYLERHAVTTASGVMFEQRYRGNGPYDPDVTNAGHQPVGYDQLSTMYKQQRTYSCAIQLTWAPAATTPAALTEMALVPTVTVTDFASGDPELMWQNPKSKFKITGTSGSGPTIIRHSILTSEMAGTKIDQDDLWSSSTGAVPGSQWFWHIGIQACDGTTTLDGFLYVELVYHVKFTQRVALGES
jgi:hypothetical protein